MKSPANAKEKEMILLNFLMLIAALFWNWSVFG